MDAHWLFKLRALSRKLSVRAGAFAVGAIGVSLAAIFFAPFVPDVLSKLVGGDAVDRILAIISSSMLVVVTFSLSTLVSTFSVVANSAPPRATKLIMEDSRAHTALSTFLGAFIFSIVSVVALSTRYYGEKGRAILFIITILVLAGVVLTIIRWIGQLSNLGQLGSTIQQVERAFRKALHQKRTHFEWLVSETEEAPPTAISVFSQAQEGGFIQSIDLKGLSRIAESGDVDIYITVLTGTFVYPDTVIAKVSGACCDEDFLKAVRDAFLLGETRTFEDDPQFAVVVLSEIGTRALSPGINDPGTAIQIIGFLTRLFLFARVPRNPPATDCFSPRLHPRHITSRELFTDAFRAISRDGAHFEEVGVFLQQSLAALGRFPEYRDAAHEISIEALQRAKYAITHAPDYFRIEQATSPLDEDR